MENVGFKRNVNSKKINKPKIVFTDTIDLEVLFVIFPTFRLPHMCSEPASE